MAHITETPADHTALCNARALVMALENGAQDEAQAAEWVAVWDGDGGRANYGACTCGPLTYTRAVALVAEDVRRSYEDVTDTEAIAHVRNTLRLPEEPPVAGAMALEEDGSTLARAYRLILEGGLGKGTRVSYAQDVNTRAGVETITRTGTLTGETFGNGMLRVLWDEDEYGHAGWIGPGTFTVLPADEPDRSCCGTSPQHPHKGLCPNAPHTGHRSHFTGAWYCDTCDSPYCENA